MRVQVVALADPEDRPFLGDEVEARDRSGPGCPGRRISSLRGPGLQVCADEEAGQLMGMPRDVLDLVPPQIKLLPAASRSNGSAGSAVPGPRAPAQLHRPRPGSSAAMTRSISRPMARMPAPCMSRLCGRRLAPGLRERVADRGPVQQQRRPQAGEVGLAAAEVPVREQAPRWRSQAFLQHLDDARIGDHGTPAPVGGSLRAAGSGPGRASSRRGAAGHTAQRGSGAATAAAAAEC